jgi:signal transduction histidine kinase
MGTTYQQVLDLITTNPGNLIYHVVLALTVFGALQAALNLYRDDEFPQGRRMVFGLGLLLGTRLLLFLTAGLVNLGLADPHVLLPNIDRAVMALSLVIIIWLWVFPEPWRFADTACGLLSLFVLTIFLLIQIWWGRHHTASAFNLTFPNTVWEIFALIMLVASGILMILKKPNGWGYGIAMMATFTMGHLIHILFPDVSSDYPGAVRLFELAGFPLLWSIPNRFDFTPTKIEKTDARPLPIDEPKLKRFEPKFFQTILALMDNSSLDTTHQKLTKLLAETLFADICLLFHPPDEEGKVFFHCGYDLIREVYLSKLSIDSEKIPMLISAMKRRRPLRLPASSTAQDITSIAQILNLERMGNILAAFVPPLEGDNPIMGIVLVSQNSERRWSRDDQAFINKISATLPSILDQTNIFEKIQSELSISEHNLHSAQTKLQEVLLENADLQNELTNFSEGTIQAQEKEFTDLVGKLKESQETIDHLKFEKTLMEKLPEEFKLGRDIHSPDFGQLQEELKLALTEVAHLQNQLSSKDQNLLELHGTGFFKEKTSLGLKETFTSIAQDLMQSISSINGYTNLLLSEFVGVQDDSKRKFLERIKASTERIDILLDDLIQVATHETQNQHLRPEAVGLESVFDNAIIETRSQFQKRGLILRVDLLDEMPQLLADQDALQQILIHLLKNAGTASPINGEIFMRTSIYQTEDMQDFVLIQVADQGGGIPKEDLPRVFSSLYRADNPLIQGIGESGVGLSIAKLLVEAHNGKIWVDTEMGIGSTFNFLIPLLNREANNMESASEEVPSP